MTLNLKWQNLCLRKREKRNAKYESSYKKEESEAEKKDEKKEEKEDKKELDVKEHVDALIAGEDSLSEEFKTKLQPYLRLRLNLK